MSGNRIEPRLQAHIRDRVSGAVPVVIQLELAPLPENATYPALIERMAAPFETVAHALRSAGFQGELDEQPLAGAIEASLSPAQIEVAAALPEVRRIIWNRTDQGVFAAGAQ